MTALYVVLVGFSEEFVLGYIQVLDGERDPRNLVLAFSSVLIIAKNFTFGKLLHLVHGMYLSKLMQIPWQKIYSMSFLAIFPLISLL